MARTNQRPLKKASNEAILNAIWNDSSSDYQRRIPYATQGAIQDTVKTLHQYRPLWNEFLDALINRIGSVIARNISWQNPLAEFKRGMLEYGDTIEEIQTGLLQAHIYDPDREYLERDLFGTEVPEVQTSFHTVNRQNFYKVTVNQPLLQRAFQADEGLSDFVTQLLEAPSTSDYWDEFLTTVQLFPEYENNGGFWHVNVPDVKDLESSEADAKSALRKMRAMADKLKFISTRYNAAHMPTFADRDDLVVFVSPEFNAAIDVEALASAFNTDRANMHGRIIPIPEEHFGVEGAQAIMTTKDFFVIADQRLENASQWNAAALHNNYFLHHWQVISASRFVPAVMFWTGQDDEVIEIRTPVESIAAPVITNDDGEEVTEVQRGLIYAATAEVTTNPEDGINVGVRWTVEGATSNRTHITPTGVLQVGGDEGASSLTVRGTTTWLDSEGIARAGESATTSVTVTGDPVIDWPRESEAEQNPEPDPEPDPEDPPVQG